MVLLLQLWLVQLLLHQSGREQVRKARTFLQLLVRRVRVEVKNLLNQTALLLRIRDEKGGVLNKSKAVRKKNKVRINPCRPQNRKTRQ
jgi:hypothetical protein